MLRFLVGTVPVASYVSPMLPIVDTLVKRGHTVLWYTGELFQADVEAVGAQFVAMSNALDFSVIEKVPSSIGQQRESLKGLAQLRFDLKYFFIDHAIGQVQDYQLILQDFPADVLLCDSYFLGAGWIHELGGPPWAQLGTSVLMFPSQDIPPFGLGLQPTQSASGRLRDKALKSMTNLILRGIKADLKSAREQLGLVDNKELFFDTLSPYLHLVTTVPSFEYPRSDLPPQVHFIGPPFLERPQDFEVPSWWSDLQNDHPIIYVTQDTLSTDINDLIVPTIEALSDKDILSVVTGRHIAANLAQTPLPSNTRFAPYIPHNQLLPQVNIMVSNGDYRDVQHALSYGIPLIVAGQSEDKPEICARVDWSGVGLNLNTKRPKPQQVRNAVEEILSNDSYAVKAQQLRTEIRQYKPSELAAEYLESMASNVTSTR
ncbi:MAG: nucleotide disphospho-sugar-binding domain-containing protein [Cyanobacteria bacterium P01_D01_bin.156]